MFMYSNDDGLVLLSNIAEGHWLKVFVTSVSYKRACIPVCVNTVLLNYRLLLRRGIFPMFLYSYFLTF